MASELESEPAIEYAIKLHMLFKLNGLNKTLKDPMVENYCRSLINELEQKKNQIGQLNDHKKHVEEIIVGEYKALIDDFNNKLINAELIEGFIKIAKLFEVLTVFNVDENMKQKYISISKNAQKYALKIKREITDTKKTVPITP